MKRLFLLLVLMFSCAFAQAQSKKFSIEIKTGTIIDYNPIDNVGSVMEYDSHVKQDGNLAQQNYSFRENDILIERNNGDPIPFSVKLYYRPDGEPKEGFLGGTNYSISLNKTVRSGSISGNVSSEPAENDGVNVRWIRMWDANIIPVANKDNPSGLSSVEYFSDDRINNLGGKLILQQNVFNIEDYILNVSGGVNTQYFQYDFNVGQKQEANIPTGGDVTFNNEITLRSTSRSKSFMVGPTLGVNFERTFWKRFNINFGYEYSYFHNWSNHQGLFSDTDYIEYINKGETGYINILDGTSRFSKERRDYFSSNSLSLEMGIKSDVVSFGLSANVKSLNNIPLIPTFHNPWALTGYSKAPSGLDWKIKKRNLNSFMLMFYSKINF